MKKKKPFKKAIIFCLSLILIITGILLYSRYIGTSGLDIKEYKIKYNELSNDFYGLKIVHISDIHYGRTTKEKELQELVDKINLTKPDIVIFTGDLIDKDTNLTEKDKENIEKELERIDANIGKYAITGNHDYKRKEYQIIIENSGFINLDDTYDLIYTNQTDYILISGMSTNSYGKEKAIDKINSTIEYINNAEKKPNYSILIMHEPDFIDEIDSSKFNLILAGHSHNGQIRLPFVGAIIKPKNAKKYYDEHYKIKNTNLYISSGVGTSEISFRLFNHPSFNLYRLTN